MLHELLATLKKFKEIVIIYLASLVVISFILHTEMLFHRNSNLSGYCIIGSVCLIIYKLNKLVGNKDAAKGEKIAVEAEIKTHNHKDSFDFDLDDADCEIGGSFCQGEENG